jgi:MFS family permease
VEFLKHTSKRGIVIGWLICILAALFYCYEYLLRIEPSVMVPELMHSFDITAGGLSTLVAMYYYAYTPLQAVVGVLTDRFGPRRILMVAIVCCAAGAWVFGSSHVIWVAGFGRFLIGVGSAFAFVGVLKLAAIWLPKERFAMFTGLATSLGMVGAMFGDVELSRVVHSLGWHHVMMLSVVVGIILLGLFFVFVKDRHRISKANVQYHEWRLLFSELWSLVKTPQLWIAGLIGCILYLSLTVLGEMWGIPFLHSIYPTRIGLPADLNAMIFFGWLLGSPFTGWLSDRVRSRRYVMMVGSFMAALIMALILIFVPKNPYMMGGLLFLLGAFCSAEILAFVVARESTPLRLAATAIGFINFLVMLGGMIIQPAVGHLLDVFWTGQTHLSIPVYHTLAYRYAMGIVPVMMLSGVVLAYFLKETYGAKND